MKNVFSSIKERFSRAGSALKSRKAEGHTKTAVIIIIAVVIGGLLIAGLVALFTGRNGVLAKTETQLNEMVNMGGTRELRLNDHQMEYSYDGETWMPLEISGLPSDAVTNQFITLENEEQSVYLISCKSNRAWLYTSTDGKNWTPTFSDNNSLNLQRNGSGATLFCGDGRTYVTSDGINWRMTSTKNY